MSKDKINNNMNSIFHYCSTDTLKAILKNKTLRLADIRKSNDTKEIEFLFDKCRDFLIDNKNHLKTNNEFFDFFELNKNIRLSNTVFLVSCFSKKEDDIHMWNCYGNEGVSIEFDRIKLEEYLNYIRLGVPQNVTENKKKELLEKHALRILDIDYYNNDSIKNYFLDNKVEKYEDFWKIFGDSPFIKNDFFQCEEEVRILHTYYADATFKANHLSLVDKNENVIDKLDFGSISNNKFDHRMIIDIPIDFRIIKSITLGPNCKITEQDVRELFFIYGIRNIIIKKSKGSLR